EERAVAVLVEGHEPQARPRLARETEAHVDAFSPQLAVEQMPELVVSDDAGECRSQAESRGSDGYVGGSSAGVNGEPLAIAQPAAPVGEQIDECLAEAEDVRGSHRASIMQERSAAAYRRRWLMRRRSRIGRSAERRRMSQSPQYAAALGSCKIGRAQG